MTSSAQPNAPTRFRVKTLNQPSSYFTVDCPLTAEKLSEVLGWDPAGDALGEVLETLLAGKPWTGRTTKVPMDKGTDCVEFHLEPLGPA